MPSGDFYHIQKAAADADFWTQLLCIQADRNPSLGMYYPGKLVKCTGSGSVKWSFSKSACPAVGSRGPPVGLDGVVTKTAELAGKGECAQHGQKAAVVGYAHIQSSL